MFGRKRAGTDQSLNGEIYIETLQDEHLEQDLGTAAFLQVRGFRLMGLAPSGAGRYVFRFVDPDGKATQAVLGYLQGEAVAAYSLVAAEKNLKTLLH